MKANSILLKIKENNIELFNRLVEAQVSEEEIESNIGFLFKMLNQEEDYHVVLEDVVDGKLIFNYEANSKEAKVNKAVEDRNKMYLLRDFPNTMLTAGLEDVIQNVERREVLSAIAAIVNEGSKEGIYLHGTYGTGKSFMMVATLNRLADQGMTVAQVNISNFFSNAKASFDIQGDNYLKDSIEKMKEADALLIDDIGGEVISQWSREEVLYPILNHRMEHGKITLFTSNLSLEKYAETLKISHKDLNFEAIAIGRLLERIKTTTKQIFVGGENYRYKK